MREEQSPPPPVEAGHATQLILVGVVAAAFVGFLVGIDVDFSRGGAPLDVDGASGPARDDGVRAMGYADMRLNDLGPNSAWSSDFERLDRPGTNLLEEYTPNPAAKLVSLNERAGRRAYDGAPPVIPHRVDTASDANCVLCHTESVRIGNATSKVMPHTFMVNCQQCHAQADGRLFEPYADPANSFSGKPAPEGGDRAWTGAPPVIPHTTLMRESCLSCHGPNGDHGIRTPHAYQSSCLQCHAPTAKLDQRLFSAGTSSGPEPGGGG